MIQWMIVLMFVVLPVSLGAQPEAQIHDGEYTSAKVCGKCHVAIHKGWSGSMHAMAVDDPTFYPIFLETSRETGGKSDPLCLSCHSPTTRLTKDWALKNPLSHEGVTCDFCHTIQNVTPGTSDPLQTKPGSEKRGPLKDVTSPAHGTVYSDLFAKSEFCAGCHDYTTSLGAPILETYSEWKKSPQAQEGKTCQTCHMPKVEGLVVPAHIQATKEVYINSHEAAGGHDVDQVKKAISVKLEQAKRLGDKMDVVVRIENVGSGHKVPTGLPTRKLVVRMVAKSGGSPIYSEERFFQKTLVNDKGEVITKDADLFLRAVRVKEDTRLEPRKPREEHFSFLAPSGKAIEVEVETYYHYQPRLIQETEMKIELGKERIVVP